MYKRPHAEPIAIIGSSCRFAGQVTSPSKLWQVLASPPDLSKEVPSSRFNAPAFYHEDGEHHGTTNSIKGYWLEQDHRVFDASFFNITPKEAEAIDPQQRLLLEVVYEAMESTGYTLHQHSGKDVGVFAGVMTADYDTLSQRDELSASQYYATGNARSIISNRISYFFNFRGPSMTIDTACSSSLVALHQAVLSLRSGETPMACVTGVNLMITPEQFIVESSLHMLSPSGQSRMWDQSADGYARGEGVAAIFLKSLSSALRDGDDVLGIIRQTGVNSDGRTPGITMPNPDAQASLIRSTYRTSGLDSFKAEDRCQYFEAHGTGTQAGDPREAQAIHEAFFGADTADIPAEKLLVGSVKTVIGHTEGAAGLAGVLKVLQAMKHGQVPPNLHLDNLNPTVRPYYTHLEIPTVLIPWPQPSYGQPKRASVNSFGFGGTNSHAIIEHYDSHIHDATCDKSFALPGKHLQEGKFPNTSGNLSSITLPLVLSASSQKSLMGVVSTWRDYLLHHPEVSLNEVAWNSLRYRTALPYRLCVTATSKNNAIEILGSLGRRASDGAELGIRAHTATRKPRILGIFTGQGAQWPTMSRQLLLSSGIYRRTIQELDQVLRQAPDPPCWSLEEQIMADATTSQTHKASISQPLCTALQIGLVDLLQSIGVTFQAVVGHSSGEIAAAYAAQRLSARDAILIAYYRGLYAHLASGTNGEKGGMMAVGISQSEALEFCRDPIFQGKICVAACNAPSSITISGDLDMIHMAKDKLTVQARFARLLQVDTAYHSPHMARPAVAYTAALEKCGISPSSEISQTPWISSVYGFSQTTEKDLASGYWKDNMVDAVQFHDAVQTALTEFGPFDCAIEVGPHPALKGPTTQTVKATLGVALPYYGLLERAKDDRLAFSEFLGSTWCRFGLFAFDAGEYVWQSSDPSLMSRRLEELPPYQWDHTQTHYRESRISRQYHFRKARPHELLGVRTRDDNEFELRWRNIIRPDKLPWLQGHSFQGQALVPASAYCVMALAAALQMLNGRNASIIEIQDLDIMSGISMESDSVGTETLFSLKLLDRPTDRETTGLVTASFNLTSCLADGRTSMKKNVSGNILIVLNDANTEALPHRKETLSETLAASPDGFYKMMSDTELVYTGPFKAIKTIQRRCNFASTTLRRRHDEDTTRLSISPATLDACLQSAFLTYSSPGDKCLWTSFLPKRIARIQFNAALCQQAYVPGDQSILTVDSHLTNIHGSTPDSKAEFTTEVYVYNDKGEMEIEIEGLTVAAFAKAREEDDCELYLHTMMDLDPSDGIVISDANDTKCQLPELAEACERIASFYTSRQPGSASEIPVPGVGVQVMGSMQSNALNVDDTAETIESLVEASAANESLRLLQDLGRIMPALLPSALPMIVQEAGMQLRLHRHVEKIVHQICHKHPRMSVLSIEISHKCIGDSVLQGLGTSFSLITCLSTGASIQPIESDSKVHRGFLDLEGDIPKQVSSVGRTDLVVIDTSILNKCDPEMMLKTIRTSMSDGGFIVMIRVDESPLKKGLRLLSRLELSQQREFIPTSEQTLLESCGFVSIVKDADQTLSPGVSVSIRQAGAPFVSQITQLLASPLTTQAKKVVIIGTASEENSKLAHELQHRLSQFSGSITLSSSIENLQSSTLDRCSSVIMLEDLYDPIVPNMTDKKLSQLKDLFHPDMTILWLTQNARYGNPYHAATIGFTRTVAAEVPNFKLQVLDLEEIDETTTNLVAESFMRLIAPTPSTGNSLWVREPEIYMENGRRLIARVLPLKKFNDRLNALRRVVEKPVNTIRECVEIVPHVSEDGQIVLKTKVSACNSGFTAGSSKARLRVLYSSAEVVRLEGCISAYVCLGRDAATGETKMALSATNTSYIEVAACLTQALPDSTLTGPQFLHRLVRDLVALATINKQAPGENRIVIYIDGDQLLLQSAKRVADDQGLPFSSWTTSPSGELTSIRIHARASDRQIRALIPPAGAVIYDFSSNVELSQRLKRQLPANSEYHAGSTVFSRGHIVTPRILDLRSGIASIFSHGVKLAAQTSRIEASEFSQTQSVNEATSATRVSTFNIINWISERSTTEIITPLVEQHLFSASKTYILIGLTRDFGQSLSRLFVQHGACNIVLASRNPDMSPKWATELLQSHGARVVLSKLDVTCLEDVLHFKKQITSTMGMPPVGGVINGAMVLDDRTFSQMTLETWNRCLRPKTMGSKNLDLAFLDASLEFFIMTSSFAAIGGHPGQSNYAAANMYMNGLAANRRNRGLVGSVLNIGVIYGLGLLQREKEELYAGLEREGYPPISERDIHHMFLEAIVAGRPGTDEPFDITTGLKRFKWGNADPLHWHLDPRFSHFTVVDDSSLSGVEVGAQKSLLDEVVSSKDLETMTDHLVTAFSRHLKAMLQLPDGAINQHNSLTEIGIDSLVAVDIRNWVYRTLNRDVAVLKILGASSIHQFCLDIAGQIYADKNAAEESFSIDTPLTSRTPSEASPPSSPRTSSISSGSKTTSVVIVERQSSQVHP